MADLINAEGLVKTYAIFGPPGVRRYRSMSR